MKRLFLMSALFLLGATFAFAQFEEEDSERVQQMRVEFFNEELQFTPEESAAFWPIYKDFRAEKRALQKKLRPNRRMELMTDAEAERFLEDNLNLEEQQLALKRQYINRLKSVISVRKIAMISKTERKFKKTLLTKIRERREERRRR